MTRKVFWEDPYLTELETTVTGVKGNEITVEQTIFYALSGGQESDRGTIGDFNVVTARKDSREIVYTLEDGHNLNCGDRARMKIDWKRRYKLMRLHFAAELVLELIYKHLGAIEKTGAHIAQHKARIEFEWGDNLSKILPAIQTEALEIIQANREIISDFSDRATERRYWKIEELAQVPCGGTHIKRTGEIGEIQLKRKTAGKGKEKIEIYLNENPS
jgi:Ser-tRNA(Ala) deacylase AlaX